MKKTIKYIWSKMITWYKGEWSDSTKWFLDVPKAVIIAVLLYFILDNDMKKSVEKVVGRIQENEIEANDKRMSLIRDAQIEAVRRAKTDLADKVLEINNYASVYFFGVGREEDRQLFQSYSGYKTDLDRLQRVLEIEVPEYAQYIEDTFEPLLCVIRIKPGQEDAPYAAEHREVCSYNHTKDEFLSTGVINKLIIGLQNGEYDVGRSLASKRAEFGRETLAELDATSRQIQSDLDALIEILLTDIAPLATD